MSLGVPKGVKMVHLQKCQPAGKLPTWRLRLVAWASLPMSWAHEPKDCAPPTRRSYRCITRPAFLPANDPSRTLSQVKCRMSNAAIGWNALSISPLRMDGSGGPVTTFDFPTFDL